MTMDDILLKYKKTFDEGLTLFKNNNFVSAEEKFEEVLKQFPERVSVLTNLLAVKMKLKKFHDSERLISQLIQIDSSNKEAIFNNAILLAEKGFFDQSLNQINNFISLKNLSNYDLSEAYSFKGVLYSKLGLFSHSLKEHKRAAKQCNNNYLAKWNLGLSYLLNGDLERGFELYEYRFLKNNSKFRNTVRTVEEIKNKNILVLGEQGFGDIIQFSRYLPLLQQHVRELTFLPPLELFDIFNNTNIKVIKSFNLEDYDFIIPLMSLPYIFQTSLQTIPSSDYLVSDSIKKKQLNSNKINIGLSWSGRDTYPYDFLRSIPLQQLESIYSLDPNKFQFYCLQKDIRNSDQSCFDQSNIVYFKNNSFADIAKIILDLDLVISSDTSILHLAATLQVKTFGLIPYCPDWRWLLDIRSSPWYPSLHIYRCNNNNDWTTVSDNIIKDINVMFA